MSHLSPGLISAYNSLTDRHLAGYFSSTRIRRHLQRAGLITRSGRIVPDKEYRHKLIQRQHQRHVRECLARAVCHKVLEMERVHQVEIKRRLEEFARRERVQKIKVERSKRYEEDIVQILSPRPPTNVRGVQKQRSGPEGEQSESSESLGSTRPNTAPGKMQRPVRLKPIHSNSTTASLRRSSPYRPPDSSVEHNQTFNCTTEPRRRMTRMEASCGISPYCLPVINNFVAPAPPATKRKERGLKVAPCSTLRGRRLRPTTSFSGADVNEDPPLLRSAVHQSRVSVNMVYLGKTVHLSHDLHDMRDEVKVCQQHCGGENLCVYKGMLREGDTFRFISRRHRGFPFSLTFFLNGLQVERLSSCCEFKHRKGSRLDGRHRHFGFSGVEGAAPCYKCILAMGLDKKPNPPPKRLKEDRGREESVTSPKDSPEMQTQMNGENSASRSECESDRPLGTQAQLEERTAAVEGKVRDDYEEDFEADDEGPAEDTEAKEKKSPSPFSDTQSPAKGREASETEDGEKDDITSRSSCSSSGSEQEESDAEGDKDSTEDEEAEEPQKADREETVVAPDQTGEPSAEETSAADAECAVANSAGDSTEIDISDSSIPSGNEMKQSDDTSGDTEVAEMVRGSNRDAEQERAKSVQEKLAEAILKESHCSSEPELSDTSTEEDGEETSAHKGPQQDNKGPLLEESVTHGEQQQKTKCEGGQEDKGMVQDEEEKCDIKEKEDETEQKPHQKNETDEEDEKAAESHCPEDAEDAGLHPVHEEEMQDKKSEPQKDKVAKSTDIAGKAEEETAEADTHPDQMGQEAKSKERENDSSVSEPAKEADETAMLDNAVAGVMTASATTEMKTEPSEDRRTLSREEVPVTDSEDRAAASETEVTAENSSSSPEGGGDTTVEVNAETSRENAEKEKEEAEEESAGEAKRQQDSLGEEQTEESVEKDGKVEEKSEEDSKEPEKQTNPHEITEGDKSEERKVEDNESKTEKRVENEENVSDLTKSDSNMEVKENEQAEKTHNDEVTTEGKADESEKMEKNGDSECVMKGSDEEEKGGTSEGDNRANTIADEDETDLAEEEEDRNENRAEQSGTENKDATGETAGGEEKSEIAQEAGKAGSEENVIESDVADEPVTIEETRRNTVEAADEEREIDAENGETSSKAENRACENEGEAQAESENEVKVTEDEIKSKEPTGDERTEVKELTVEGFSGKLKNDEVDQIPDADVSESEVKGGDDSVEIQEESAKNNSKPEASGTEMKEESPSDKRTNNKETRQDENCNLSEPDHETRESDLIRKEDDVQSKVTEVNVASSEHYITPMTVDLDDTTHKFDDSNKPFRTDKGTSAATTDLSAVEEASKASEEGASVLLKPAAQSSLVAQREESVVSDQLKPEALASEEANIDLVSNWVTMHQASKFFETFVEPLDDLKSDAQVTHCTPSMELLRSMEIPESVEERAPKDESRDNNKEEATESELLSNRSEDGDPVKDVPQEETKVTDLIPDAENEENHKESLKGNDISRGSPEEDKGQEGLMQDNTQQNDISKTEVESIVGGSTESISVRQTGQKTTDSPEFKEQTTVVDIKDLMPSFETEEQSAHPEGLAESNVNDLHDREETWEKSGELTKIRNFTGDDNMEESHHDETPPKPSDESVSKDRGDMPLVRDVQHSKDRLSPISVDETLFAQRSYPLLAAARTDSTQ